MPCIPLHQTWQIYPRSAGRSTPPTINHRCLAYHYTKLGRSTPDLLVDLPPTIKHRCLAYHYTKLGRSIPDLLADLPPTIKHRCLAYHYTKLGRSTPTIEHRCLAYHYTKLGRSTPDLLADLLPPQSIIHALHTITPNLADLPPKDLPAHMNGNFTFLLLQLI